MDVHPTLDPWNRRVAPTSFGNATAGRGANGVPHLHAVSDEYCRCGAHLVGQPCYLGYEGDAA